MSFERLKTQVYVEKLCGCTDLAKWGSYQRTLRQTTLTKSQCQDLQILAKSDAQEIYVKGLITLCEAIRGIDTAAHSWAAIKLFYSVFYFIRASTLVRWYATIKNSGFFVFDLQSGDLPSRQNSRNDHDCTFKLWKAVNNDSDVLLGNLIDGVESYAWLQANRDQVNYRQKSFLDPTPPDFLTLAASRAANGRLDELLKAYFEDSALVYCFQPDHASLCLPIRRLLATRQDLQSVGCSMRLQPELRSHLTKITAIRYQRIPHFASCLV